MSALQTPFGPAADLSLDVNKERLAQERMAALQMVLSLHSSGVSVFGENPTLGTVHNAVKTWQKYIFEGQAIGSGNGG